MVDAPLPLTLPITAQLRSSDGECWEAVYFEAGVSRNEPGRFKANAGPSRPQQGISRM